MDGRVKQILKNPIQLADQVIKVAHEASYSRSSNQWGELKSITEELATLLRLAARESWRLHERPTQRIIQETEQALSKALSLVKYRLFKLVFPTIRAAAFRKVSFRLQDSIGNVSWFLRIFNVIDDLDDDYLFPTIAVKEPILCRIWEQIAILLTGSPERRSEGAAILVSRARNDKRYRKLIIEEGGVSPLLKLLTWGNIEGQENAARAIGLLGHDPESVKHMIHVGVCPAFAQVLEKGPTSVQAVVAWAVCEHVKSYPKCQDDFAEHNIVRLLVNHLALLSTEANSKKNRKKGWVPMTLWLLAKGNSPVCRTLAESMTLLHFAVLLGTRSGDVQYYSIMALTEITAVEDADLRESAFKPNSPACKAILDQVLRIFPCETNSKLLIPCIKTIGNLARATTDTRMIGPLARFPKSRRGYRRNRDVEVCREALIALTKYACTENDLHMDHSKEILSAVGAADLIDLVYFGVQMLKIPALVLLSYIALHLPHSEHFTRFRFTVLAVLEWASNDSSMILDEFVEELLRESKSRLELSSKFF